MKISLGAPWVAQLFKHPALDFGSGHDPVRGLRDRAPRRALCWWQNRSHGGDDRLLGCRREKDFDQRKRLLFLIITKTIGNSKEAFQDLVTVKWFQQALESHLVEIT